MLGTQAWAKSFLQGGAGKNTIEVGGLEQSGDGREQIAISRKSGARDSDAEFSEYDSDTTENKYRRRGVMQLLVALGVLYVLEVRSSCGLVLIAF